MVVLGFVGCANCHTPWILKVIKARSDARVKAVYEHDRDRAARLTSGMGCQIVSDASAIWDDPEIAGVFICSENDRKAADAERAAAARKPIFVEKPFGYGASDALSAARKLEDAGILFSSGYRTRSEGMFIFLRDQMKRGSFGKLTRIRYITAHGGALNAGASNPDLAWMSDPAQAAGGAFFDLGVHALDAIMWLAGEKVVSATAAVGRAKERQGGGDLDDYGEGLVRFESGAIGSMAGASVDVEQPVRCIISGTEGHAHVVNQKLYFRSSRVPGADGKAPFSELPPDRPLAFDIFIDALAGKGDGSFITATEAARVNSVHEAMRIGAREGRWVEPAW
jgi:predicted dehydrogenase